MKFSCELCKTRYSIADERVRGKILKIRCKTCSAVITVREGMDEGVVSDAAQPVPSSSTIQLPTLATPEPPPSLHEEWYVSIEGNQEGPFGLAHAQAWVAARPASDELFCWSEGFDDWLPVEKVSHFRGLRAAVKAVEAKPEPTKPEVPPVAKGPDRPAAKAAPAEAKAAPAEAKAAPGGLRPLPKLGEGGSALKPLPALGAKADEAKKAAAEAEAKKAAERLEAEAKKAAEKLEAEAKKAAEQAEAEARKAAEKAEAEAKKAAEKLEAEAKKAAAEAEAKKAAEQAEAAEARKAAEQAEADRKAADAKKADRKADDAARKPAPSAPPPTPASAPLAASGPEASASSSGTALSPVAAAIAAASAPFAGASGVRPATAPPPSGSRSTSPPPSGSRGTSPPPNGAKAKASDEGDDLSIGEVSRVLKLADLGVDRKKRKPSNGAAAPAPAEDEPRFELGSSAALEVPAVTSEKSTRRPLALYALLGAVAIGAIVAIVYVATQGGGDDEPLGQVGPSNDYTDLGRRVDDPAGPRPGSAVLPGSGSGSGTGSGSATVRRPGSGARPQPGSGSGSGSSAAGSGSGSAPVDVPLDATPLTADDIIAMSQKMATGTRRCYDRALKEDPFLKVSKISATIAVGTSGAVTNVQLSSMTGTPIGNCLEAAIRRWRFHASPEGIVSEIALVFGKG